VSGVAIEVTSDAPSVQVTEHLGPKCARCWKHYEQLAKDPNDVCERCAEALRAIKA
jgi:predicted amidophosphoribosyltransferase